MLLPEIQKSFADALPRIEGLASAYLGFQRDKEEAVAETVALSWKAYRVLAEARRDVTKLLGKIVEFSAKRVRCGRRLVGCRPVQDVMSGRIRRVGFFDLSETLDLAFRVELEEWLEGLDDRRRTVAQQLASGLNTVEVSRLHGVSRGRISQLRENLIDSWEK